MKIKNKDLLPKINGIPLISNLKMPGVVSLAVFKGQKAVKDSYLSYSAARAQVIESRCKKDESGKPVMNNVDETGNVLTEEAQKTYTGKICKAYVFDTPEIEKESIDEVNSIDQKETDFTFDVVDEKILHSIECTPHQMALIKSFID